MTAKILRLLEDYVSDSSDPSTNSQITLYKRNLLLQVTAPKNKWVLVRSLVDTKIPPIWIPHRLVRKAQAGFYRVSNKVSLCDEGSVHSGDIIEVLSIELGYKLLDHLWCKVRLIDGRTDEMLCESCEIEPVDVPIGPPASTSRPVSTTEQPDSNLPKSSSGSLRSILGSFSRRRGRTVDASNSIPPPYDCSKEGHVDSKS